MIPLLNLHPMTMHRVSITLQHISQRDLQRSTCLHSLPDSQINQLALALS